MNFLEWRDTPATCEIRSPAPRQLCSLTSSRASLLTRAHSSLRSLEASMCHRAGPRAAHSNALPLRSFEDTLDPLLWRDLAFSTRPTFVVYRSYVVAARCSGAFWCWRRRASLGAAVSWFWRHSCLFRFRAALLRTVARNRSSLRPHLASCAVRLSFSRWRRNADERKVDRGMSDRMQRAALLFTRILKRDRLNHVMRCLHRHSLRERVNRDRWNLMQKQWSEWQQPTPGALYQWWPWQLLRKGRARSLRRRFPLIFWRMWAVSRRQWAYWLLSSTKRVLRRHVSLWRRCATARLHRILSFERSITSVGMHAWHISILRARVGRAIRRWSGRARRRAELLLLHQAHEARSLLPQLRKARLALSRWRSYLSSRRGMVAAELYSHLHLRRTSLRRGLRSAAACALSRSRDVSAT